MPAPSRKDTGILDTAGYTDTASVLKDATDVTMGVAVGFSEMVTNASYSGIVKRDFDRVTFGNMMKHSSIVG
ncbi:MAG: hypothetical protein IPM85_00185 [Chitinophagaceae bacterium]|nr:hypothetical protein [Chitinophagaceae bacterium]